LIAATALTVDWTFITKNQRHYRFIDGLQLLPYPSSHEIDPEDLGQGTS
jgi:predicted nucleic acid-binding protein